MEHWTDRFRDALLRLLEAYRGVLRRGVEGRGLFGSFLRGAAEAGSALDVLVRSERPGLEAPRGDPAPFPEVA